jgi:transposase
MLPLPELPAAERARLSPAVQAYSVAVEQTGTTRTVRRAEREARLGQTAMNASRPPSSDPPGTPRSPAPAGGRRPGGQPGHPGVVRLLLDPEQVEAVVVCRPARCAGCGGALPAAAGAGDRADARRPVTEVPPVAAVVTAYRLAARRGGSCGWLTRAAVPAGVGTDGFGARLAAITALVRGRYRLSKRQTAQCRGDLFGGDRAVGSVSALEQAPRAARAPVVEEARVAVQQAAVANLDETGWRAARNRGWLWTVVTTSRTVFPSDASRGGRVAQALRGARWAGIVGADRGTMYTWLGRARRPVCWAHRKRDFQKLVDWSAGSRPIGTGLLAIAAAVCRLW